MKKWIWYVYIIQLWYTIIFISIYIKSEVNNLFNKQFYFYYQKHAQDHIIINFLNKMHYLVKVYNWTKNYLWFLTIISNENYTYHKNSKTK